MKLRLLASLVLLLVAIGLPVAAVSSNGAPWGFRGHHAVVLEVAGTVEGASSETRREREGRIDDKLDVVPNLHLDTGDELRVARLSEARLRFENGIVIVGDGARVVIGDQKLTLMRGLLRVVVEPSQKPFEVALDAGGTLVVRASNTPAAATFVSDGKGGVRAVVADGSLEARVAGGEVLGEPGRLLIVEGDKARVADVPTALEVTATCVAKKLTVTAPPQTQVFTTGALLYPDATAGAASGNISVDVDSADVAVFAKDVAGNFARAQAHCETAAPKKK